VSARRRRLGVTALAVLAPVLVWLVADPLLGHRLRIADGEQTLDIGAVPVGVVALLASLSGWGLLAGLERFGARRARAIWTGVAGAVLVVSFLPFIGDGMNSGTRVSLALMHLAVAVVLVPGLGGRSFGAGADAAEGPPAPR
jgi:multidrug transporter EmrE-like cation transporter